MFRSHLVPQQSDRHWKISRKKTQNPFVGGVLSSVRRGFGQVFFRANPAIWSYLDVSFGEKVYGKNSTSPKNLPKILEQVVVSIGMQLISM